MPELPEVETICRGLEPVLKGHQIQKVSLKRTGLRYPFPEDFAERLQGQSIISLKRRAKYLLLTLSSHEILMIHLGMSGRFVIETLNDHQKSLNTQGEHERRHDHVIFTTNHGYVISYRDPRRFGFMDLIAEENLPSNRHLHHIGIEPLEDQLTAGYLQQAFLHKKVSVKAALLDQTIIAGLGNIYVCEALFHSHINPQRNANSLTDKERKELVSAIRNVLQKALRAGGSTLKDYAQTNGDTGYFQHQFSVYGREEVPCLNKSCKGFIQRIVQGGRSTFFCNQCQE